MHVTYTNQASNALTQSIPIFMKRYGRTTITGDILLMALIKPFGQAHQGSLERMLHREFHCEFFRFEKAMRGSSVGIELRADSENRTPKVARAINRAEYLAARLAQPVTCALIASALAEQPDVLLKQLLRHVDIDVERFTNMVYDMSPAKE